LFPKNEGNHGGQNVNSDEVEAAVCQLFWETGKDCFKNKIKNLLNTGRSVLKLEEIMWKK
jgi:hypothetical protein